MESKEAPSFEMDSGRQAEESRNLAQAEQWFRRALAASPTNIEARLRMGVVDAKLGRIEQAIPLLSGVTEEQPECAEAHLWLASIFRGINRFDEAISHCDSGLAYEPKNVSLWLGLAQCQMDCWRNRLALKALDQAILVDPNNASALERRGEVLIRIRDYAGARETLERALEIDPKLASVAVQLASLHRHAGNDELAEAAYARAWEMAGNDAHRFLEISNACTVLRDFEMAEAAARRAIELDPQNDSALGVLASILQRTGRFEESKAALQTALQIQPGRVRHFYDLAYSGRATEDSRPPMQAAAALSRLPGLSHEDRMRLHYALGKLFDDLGEYGKAMQHFDEANGLALQRIPPGHFRPALLALATDRSRQLFTPDYFQRYQNLGNPSKRPIFVVGMIRSGTTLVEQILSSHPAIGAGGELRFLADHVASAVDSSGVPDADALASVAERYLNRLEFEAPGYERVTDKMPANFALAWFSRLAFPNGKIVHCRRNPLDNCFSAYVTPYKDPLDYGHSLRNLAIFYKEYTRLMEHWRTALPAENLFELDYEELVADREPVVRRLLEFLELPWDDACLAHEENSGAINTPSRWQARQPIYSSSVGRWRNYAAWIPELLKEFPEAAVGDSENSAFLG